MPDQIGDHGQKADIVIEPDRRAIAEYAIDRQRADHGVAVLDRHADQRKRLAVRWTPIREIRPLEQRRCVHVFDDQRHFGGEDLANRALGQMIEIFFRIGLGPTGPHDDFRFALLIQQGEQPMPHDEKTR